MAKQQFPAQRRTVIGKKVAKLRREGQIPGIIYGPVVEGTVPVMVDAREFARFYQAHGHSTLIDLRWEDGEESVFIREVQVDPVKRDLLHIDFFAPNLRVVVRTMVPLVFHNVSNTSEGVVTEARTDVEVEALPARIPSQIDVDLASLQQPGDVFRVGDLTMPESVSVITDENEVVALMEAIYVAPEDVAVEEEAEAAAVDETEGAATAEADETSES